MLNQVVNDKPSGKYSNRQDLKGYFAACRSVIFSCCKYKPKRLWILATSGMFSVESKFHTTYTANCHIHQFWKTSLVYKPNRSDYEHNFHKTGTVLLNVPLGCVLATIVAVEKQWVYYIFWVCACSLRHPACNAHAPCHLLPAPLYNIIPHYFINATIFETKKGGGTEHKMCVLIFSTTFVWKHFSF